MDELDHPWAGGVLDHTRTFLADPQLVAMLGGIVDNPRFRFGAHERPPRPCPVTRSRFIGQVLIDLGLLRMICRPRRSIADGHRRLFGSDEGIVLERSAAHQLLLIVGSIEVLDGELDIERFP